MASVVIPAYNAEAWIGEQLEALRAQIDAPPFEVLICDNNSTDATAVAALGFADQLDLRVIDAHGPASASHARNCGAVEARGDVLLFCDSDDLVDTRWVSSLHQVVASDATAVAAGALHHERFNPPGVLAAYGIPADPPSPCYPLDRRPPGFAGYLPTIAGGNFSIRRGHYLAVGGMDASLPGGSEETDFSWRAQSAGLHVVSVPEAIVHYRLKRGARSIYRQQRIQQFARIMLWTRYRSLGMSGPSFRHSLSEALKQLPRLIFARSEGDRLQSARILGGNVGALQGILVFRLLRSTPTPQLITGEV